MKTVKLRNINLLASSVFLLLANAESGASDTQLTGKSGEVEKKFPNVSSLESDLRTFNAHYTGQSPVINLNNIDFIDRISGYSRGVFQKICSCPGDLVSLATYFIGKYPIVASHKDLGCGYPLNYAVEAGNDQIAKFLIDFWKGRGEAFKKAEELNFPLESKYGFKLTPTEMAVAKGNLEIVQAMKLALGDLVFRSFAHNSFSLLHCVSLEGDSIRDENAPQVAVLRFLKESGLEVNYMSQVEGAPLHWAIRRGCLPIVLELIKQGASQDLPDRMNIPPLVWAMEMLSLDMISALLETGQIDFSRKLGLSLSSHCSDYWLVSKCQDIKYPYLLNRFIAQFAVNFMFEKPRENWSIKIPTANREEGLGALQLIAPVILRAILDSGKFEKHELRKAIDDLAELTDKKLGTSLGNMFNEVFDDIAGQNGQGAKVYVQSGPQSPNLLVLGDSTKTTPSNTTVALPTTIEKASKEIKVEATSLDVAAQAFRGRDLSTVESISITGAGQKSTDDAVLEAISQIFKNPGLGLQGSLKHLEILNMSPWSVDKIAPALACMTNLETLSIDGSSIDKDFLGKMRPYGGKPFPRLRSICFSGVSDNANNFNEFTKEVISSFFKSYDQKFPALTRMVIFAQPDANQHINTVRKVSLTRYQGVAEEPISISSSVDKKQLKEEQAAARKELTENLDRFDSPKTMEKAPKDIKVEATSLDVAVQAFRGRDLSAVESISITGAGQKSTDDAVLEAISQIFKNPGLGLGKSLKILEILNMGACKWDDFMSRMNLSQLEILFIEGQSISKQFILSMAYKESSFPKLRSIFISGISGYNNGVSEFKRQAVSSLFGCSNDKFPSLTRMVIFEEKSLDRNQSVDRVSITRYQDKSEPVSKTDYVRHDALNDSKAAARKELRQEFNGIQEPVTEIKSEKNAAGSVAPSFTKAVGVVNQSSLIKEAGADAPPPVSNGPKPKIPCTISIKLSSYGSGNNENFDNISDSLKKAVATNANLLRMEYTLAYQGYDGHSSLLTLAWFLEHAQDPSKAYLRNDKHLDQNSLNTLRGNIEYLYVGEEFIDPSKDSLLLLDQVDTFSTFFTQVLNLSNLRSITVHCSRVPFDEIKGFLTGAATKLPKLEYVTFKNVEGSSSQWEQFFCEQLYLGSRPGATLPYQSLISSVFSTGSRYGKSEITRDTILSYVSQIKLANEGGEWARVHIREKMGRRFEPWKTKEEKNPEDNSESDLC